MSKIHNVDVKSHTFTDEELGARMRAFRAKYIVGYVKENAAGGAVSSGAIAAAPTRLGALKKRRRKKVVPVVVKEAARAKTFFAVCRAGSDMWLMSIGPGERGWVESHVRDLAGSARNHRIGGSSYMSYLSPNEIMSWLNKDYDDVWGPFTSVRAATSDSDVQNRLEDIRVGDIEESAKGSYFTRDSLKAIVDGDKEPLVEDYFGDAGDIVYVAQVTSGANEWQLVNVDTDAVISQRFPSRGKAVLYALGRNLTVFSDAEAQQYLNQRFDLSDVE